MRQSLFWHSCIFMTSCCYTCWVESLSTPCATSPRLVARRIQRASSVEESNHLLNQYCAGTQSLDDGPFLAALQVCGTNSDLSTALQIFHRFPQESCRSLTISICGKCGDHQEALKILRSAPAFSLACHHAAMAACGNALAWEDAIRLLDSMPDDQRTILSCSICLTALAKANRGEEALSLLNRMGSNGFPEPDPVSYQRTALALVGMGDVDRARNLLSEMKAKNLEPSETMYDLIVSAYSKIGNWGMVKAIEKDRKTTKKVTDAFQPWPEKGELVKSGRGRTAFWFLGTYSTDSNHRCELSIGLQPHRNPGKNGIKLVLKEGSFKIGYLLMVNSAVDQSSTLLGLYLDPTQRERGLSKIVLAVWMKLCLEAGVTPVTGVMNKPLICLVLQHTFGYLPVEHKGTNVEISPGQDGAVILYSSSRTLSGAFCPRDVKRENLVLASQPTDPRGRVVRVRSPFVPPTGLCERVKTVLTGKDGTGQFKYSLSDQSLKRILLGV